MTRIPQNIARISARLPVEERAVIEEAAQLSGWSLSDYLRQRLVPAAQQDVSDAKGATARGADQ